MQFRHKLRRCLYLTILMSLIIYIGIQVHQYRMTIIEGWDYSTSRDISEYIFPNISTTLIMPNDLCKSSNLLMVIVCSAPHHFDERLAVRESWGLNRTILNSTISLYFLIGQTLDFGFQSQIEAESDTYKDIIQENFIDTYNNLTLKSLMLLKLVKTNCKNNVKYVMKIDDDMFVNLVPLVNTLLTRKSTTKVLFGRLISNAKPIRDFYDKWYAPEYMYSGEMYPNYLSGTGYVMSVDVPEILFEKALVTPLLHLEDVYLTGICATSAHITATTDKNFNFKMVPFDPCKYKTLITAHYFDPSKMRQTHRKVHSSDLDELCKIQIQYNETNKIARSTVSRSAKHRRQRFMLPH